MPVSSATEKIYYIQGHIMQGIASIPPGCKHWSGFNQTVITEETFFSLAVNENRV